MENMRTKLAGLVLATSVALGAGVALVPDADAQTDRLERLEQKMQQREERLQQAVTEGRITQERADEIQTRLAERAAAREARLADRQARRDALAESLGLTTDELAAELKAGSSLADVAAANGVDINTIIDQFEASITEHINQAVANERITQEQADEKLDGLRDQITARVNGERPERSHRGVGPRFGPRGPRG